jgi:hypothetical protein
MAGRAGAHFLLLSEREEWPGFVGAHFLLLSGHPSIGYDHFVIFLSAVTISRTYLSDLSPRK